MNFYTISALWMCGFNCPFCSPNEPIRMETLSVHEQLS